MNRAAAVLAALFFAVHVTVADIPAPLPAFLVCVYAIAGLGYLIYRSGRPRLVWRTAPW